MTIIVVKVVTFNDLQDQFNLPKINKKMNTGIVSTIIVG